ncbi:TolC family outer membrane protein [Yoonia vestfoldensis]|jgi:outer membrane protein|uniref:Outer membrane efflux protein BepC n=1 Tax=Yoonia vestfoldensis TaxID=245188 RepID=A0A1Y0EET1_9RHOB|nr:TolC family outer membrane protein [Yoonia vestfoldensis]ARU01948.1 outer membrane efflux protein BepC [Yoonia vestfoldensis]
MIKRSAIAGVAIMMTLFAAPALRAETLADTLAAAYANSGLLDQNRALLRAADENVAQSVAATLPVINWAMSTSRTYNSAAVTQTTTATTARISGSLTLYDGGANRLAVESQKEIVLSTRQSLRGIEQDVLLRAVQAYMNVRREREFVELRQNNQRLITQELQAARDRFEVGEVTRTDVSLAQARLAGSQSQLAAAQGSLAQSIEEFRAAVGRAPSGSGAASPAPVLQSVQEAKAFALRNHPAVQEVQHSVAAAELAVRRGEAALRPTLSMDSFVALDDEWNETAQIGLSLGGPIYSGGAISSQIRQLQANRDASRAGLHVAMIGVEQQVGNAYAALQVARASAQASDQQIDAARIAFEGVREEAALGSRTTLDVLNAEQELLDAQANRIAADVDEVIASYSVLAAMGLLTAEHLQLPVQQYDVSAYYNLVNNSPLTGSPQGEALDRVLEALSRD